jgi:nitric oxide reductase activation protein
VRTRLSYWMMFLSLIVLPCLAQNPQVHFPSHDVNPPGADADEARERMVKDMEKKANKERVASLKNDTDKLLKLSVELKNYVDKSNENVLSLDVIKKAEEIEKLAKSVKDKMRGPN